MDVLQKLGSSQETSECQNLLSILKGIHGGQGPNSIPRNSHTETWGHKRTGTGYAKIVPGIVLHPWRRCDPVAPVHQLPISTHPE